MFGGGSNLFGGSTPAATAPQTTSLFGAPQKPPGMGLFSGISAPTTTTPILFGGSTPLATATQPSSLFGTLGTPQPQPQQQQLQQQLQQPTGTGLFGNISTPAATTSTPSLMFGSTPLATATQPSSLFGTLGTPQPQPTLQLQQQQPTGTGLFGNFSTPAATTSTPSLMFGSAPTASTTAQTSLFGTPPKPAGMGLFSGISTPAITTSAISTAPTLMFGSTPATTAQTTSLFGTPQKRQQPGETSLFGGISTPAITTSAISTAPTPSKGLGGIPKYASSGAETTFAFGGTSDGKMENRALKELPLPQEMLLLVDELKNQIKSNKLKFTELTRSSNENIISKVSEEIEQVRGSVTVVANFIHKQTSNCEAIRKLIQEGIGNAEMANITRETPISSQTDHTTPTQYFFKLFDSFRERMHIYLREIEKAENSLSSILSVQSMFTAKELFNALKGTRDSVIVLSAKVQILHEEVIREIEAHRNLQRYLLGETKKFNLSSTTETRPSAFKRFT